MDHQEMLWATDEAARAAKLRRRRLARPRESSIEASFVRLLKRHGLLSLKLNVAGQRGWPDRLVLLSDGRVVFVELKRSGGKARKLQEHVHAQLKARRFQVAICDDAVSAAAFVCACGGDATGPLRPERGRAD